MATNKADTAHHVIYGFHGLTASSGRADAGMRGCRFKFSSFILIVQHSPESNDYNLLSGHSVPHFSSHFRKQSLASISPTFKFLDAILCCCDEDQELAIALMGYVVIRTGMATERTRLPYYGILRFYFAIVNARHGKLNWWRGAL